MNEKTLFHQINKFISVKVNFDNNNLIKYLLKIVVISLMKLEKKEIMKMYYH